MASDERIKLIEHLLKKCFQILIAESLMFYRNVSFSEKIEFNVKFESLQHEVNDPYFKQ